MCQIKLKMPTRMQQSQSPSWHQNNTIDNLLRPQYEHSWTSAPERVRRRAVRKARNKAIFTKRKMVIYNKIMRSMSVERRETPCVIKRTLSAQMHRFHLQHSACRFMNVQNDEK